MDNMVHALRQIGRCLILASTPCCIAQDVTDAQSPPTLVAAPLTIGSVTHRLVRVNRTTTDTTAWTVEFHRDDTSGQVLQVMVARTRGRTTVDSLRFDERTLIPIWQHTIGSTSRSIAFESGRIHGEVRAQASGASRAIDVASPGVVYSSTMDDIVTSRLSFAPGFQTVLRFWTGDGIETDTVRAVAHVGGDGSLPAHWIVELHEPAAVETMWIADSSRRILRHTYTWQKDGTRAEVLEQPISPRTPRQL